MKHNSKREKQIILLIIPNGEGWHDIAVKKLLALLRGMESKHNDVFYCLSCLHSVGTENEHESHKKVCGNRFEVPEKSSEVPSTGSPKNYRRASKPKTSLFPPTITHSN